MRILHVFRTPVGGLFRHVRDLARGQSAAGHDVGIVCDSTTGGATAEGLLAEIAPACALGVHRIPISRLPGAGDLSGTRETVAQIRKLRPGLIHCHGAKGGLYGRIAARLAGLPSVYTAHGGSLHYSWTQGAGAAFLGAEWLLRQAGTGLHFVCRYERETYAQKIGLGSKPNCVIHNGLWPEEIATVAPDSGAADILFIGDMRLLKGVDLLIDALGTLNRTRRTTACLVGDGPDLAQFKAQAEAAGLAEMVSFAGRLPAREAFRRGRLLVMPSRAESFPYIVLEACAARIPLLASAVGGVAEVLEPANLFPANDAQALTQRLAEALASPAPLRQLALANQSRIARDFAAGPMVDAILEFYRELGAS
jgi:glycosyltransferase involved in cell wall biosynthesis